MFTLSDLLGQDLMVERFPQISDHRCPCSRQSRPGRQVPIERVVNGILVYLVQLGDFVSEKHLLRLWGPVDWVWDQLNGLGTR